MNMTLREQFDILEYEGRWDEAIELAYDNRNQSDAMCRCIFYGWYLDLESSCIKPEVSQEAIAKARQYLESVFPEAMKSEQPDVLMEIGYGMNIVCYLFPGDPNENDRIYTGILKRAFELKPQDPISEWFYRGSIRRARDFQVDKALVLSRYPGKGEYDTYFRSMLTSKIQDSRPNCWRVGGFAQNLTVFCKRLFGERFG
jgi:hypothetical protein